MAHAVGTSPGGRVVVELDRAGWDEFQTRARLALRAATPVPFVPDPELHHDEAFLEAMSTGWSRSCRYFGLVEGGLVVSVNASRFGTRRQGAWGRYLTFEFGYTLFDHRRRGFASDLLRWVEGLARAEGLDRTKSLAATYPGVRLHLALGHDFWGIGPWGYLQIDSPLAGVDREWPDAVPRYARSVCRTPTDRIDGERLFRVLSDPGGRFRANPDEVREVLLRYGYAVSGTPRPLHHCPA